MGLKDLLGDSYKDGMTIEDIEKVLSDRKLADLSSGDYVSKGKYAELDKKYKDIENKLKETLIQVMYDCCGVPLASSSVTSGGDTQGARQLGNGWENAYTIILKDINSLLKADRELLKIMLWICKQS